MSDNIQKKKHKKKKSFLSKVSKAFGGKKRSKTRSESSSAGSNDEFRYTTDCDTSSPTSSNTSPRNSPAKTTEITPANIDSASNLKQLSTQGEQSESISANLKKNKREIETKIANEIGNLEGIMADNFGKEEFRNPDDLRLLKKNDDTPLFEKQSGSDRNLKVKKNFMEKLPNENEKVISSLTPNDSTFDGIQLEEILEGASGSKVKTTKKFMKIEKKSIDMSSDSDESDTSEYTSDDENENFIESESDTKNIKDSYFTTGKYITYFFLEFERKWYNPKEEVYSYIHYHDANKDLVNKDQSSSDSASPCLSGQLRHKWLQRRSMENLTINNSLSNSIQHSSPESIKSAPIHMKPRSTSHDTLPRKNNRYGENASMDSLAKQALLAAQVLNLIPTQKARERNFLHGRIAANSLLGSVELEKVLPNREIKIFVGTWNMNGQTPPKELNDFMLPSEIQTIPDMLAIGTQESCSERTEWEAALQETLGPSHVLLTSTSLGTLHLALFLRRDLIWFCSVPEEGSFSTRPGTAFRTKGGIALAVILFGTSFLFVTAHLTAHQDKVKERVNDIKRIVRNLELPKDLPTKHKSKDVTQNFDCVFWCGDLNFRLSQPREEVIQWVSDTSFPQESPVSLAKDQLRMILNEGAVLRGFEEGPITFPPTYKYDPGTQTFDSSSKQRTPAYTDRILFKGKGHTRGYIRRTSHESVNSSKDGIIECLVYDSVPSICTSDHKPVWGVFKTTIRPGIDTIPLAAGLFNREIYLEGIRRRAAAMDDSHETSKVCSLQ